MSAINHGTNPGAHNNAGVNSTAASSTLPVTSNGNTVGIHDNPNRLHNSAAGSSTLAAPSIKRALIVLSSATPTMADGKTKSGFYWSEVYHPFEVFRMLSYQVDAVSLTGKAEPDESSISTMAQIASFEIASMAAYANKKHDIHTMLQNIRSPSDIIRPEDYSIIFFAGGHAVCWDFPNATPLHQLAARIYENGGVVAAVCHGPVVLGGLKLSNGKYLVEGKRATGFTVEEEEKVKALDFLKQSNVPLCGNAITQAGGHYESGPAFKEFVIVDQRLVTGQNPQSANATALRAVNLLEGRTEL